ncbi:MAG TPA: hypothetical protein VFN41_13020 [Candidatus Limnocylindrales bacterium]|nr:hypothetical protein [Candidatus Limnocylindrales bacterium]
MLRRLAPGFALTVGMILAIAIAGTSTAANTKYRTFGTGSVSVSGDTARINNDSGEYGGVYLRSRSLSSKPLRAVHVSFHSTGDVGGGAPRFSIPLNTGHRESTAPYAFLDVNNCGSNFVSTDSSSCQVFINFNGESFANWDALVARHPSWRVKAGGIPFIIADVEGDYRVTNIDLR